MHRRDFIPGGVTPSAILRQALDVAKNFRPLTHVPLAAILSKTKIVAAHGKYEMDKISTHFDNDANSPELGWAGLPSTPAEDGPRENPPSDGPASSLILGRPNYFRLDLFQRQSHYAVPCTRLPFSRPFQNEPVAAGKISPTVLPPSR